MSEEYLDDEHYEIVKQLRQRRFGKGILEERAARQLTKARRQINANKKHARLWRALVNGLPKQEAERIKSLAEQYLEEFERDRAANLADAKEPTP